jgi:hypothetical protein
MIWGCFWDDYGTFLEKTSTTEKYLEIDKIEKSYIFDISKYFSMGVYGSFRFVHDQEMIFIIFVSLDFPMLFQ